MGECYGGGVIEGGRREEMGSGPSLPRIICRPATEEEEEAEVLPSLREGRERKSRQ